MYQTLDDVQYNYQTLTEPCAHVLGQLKIRNKIVI